MSNCTGSDSNGSGTNKSVVMIGVFPPPLHGMAVVNAVVRERLVGAGAEVRVIDVAAPSLDRGLMQRLGRLPKVLRGLVGLALLRGVLGRPLYMSVSGGLGQVYELGFLVVARIKGMYVVLHHHSFFYLDKPTFLTRLLLLISGKNSIHFVQSKGMGEKLKAVYPLCSRFFAMSNATLLLKSQLSEVGTRYRLHEIGFLSNLSAEKGVFDFLDVCEAVVNAGLTIQCKLAGPFEDTATEEQVRARLSKLPNIEYVGAQYGEDKSRFYKSIDVFLFPTRYRNETEGLVGLEALQHGLPVIAYGRGAIPEYIDEDCGHVVAVGGDFVTEALQCLRTWLEQPETYQAASKVALERFQATQADGLNSWERLMRILLTGNADDLLEVGCRNKTDEVV